MLNGLIRIVSSLTLACSLMGCASTSPRQQNLQFSVGTTLEQAVATFGRPPNTITLNTSHGQCELWPSYNIYHVFCGGTYRTRSLAAEDIYAAYQRNQLAADERWGKSWFLVNGWVEGIGKDILGTPYLALRPGGSYTIGTVQCMFRREDTQRLASVSKGEMAVLKCERAGFLIMNVILNNCSFFDGLPFN